MARMTGNDDIFGDSETDHHGELGGKQTHSIRTMLQQESEQKQEEAETKKWREEENRRRAEVGLPLLMPVHVESPFGRGSDVDRLEQQQAIEDEEYRKQESDLRRSRGRF